MRTRHAYYALFLCIILAAIAKAEPPRESSSIFSDPTAFETLVHPNCSHCRVEADRRKDEFQPDDRVLCWMQVEMDGYVNDGVIPIRFFLNKYRVVSDSWGVFVYDPDAGFARGFAPDRGPFQFQGWRDGVMTMRGEDGTVYSGLTGVAFDGPGKGSRLQPQPTLVTDWQFWEKQYPSSVAYLMYDKYKPLELPAELNENSRNTRIAVDDRLPADTPILGVWDGQHARAYPLDALKEQGVIHETFEDVPRIVLWYGPTQTAAAFHQPFGTSGLGDAGWIFHVDSKVQEAPFVDQRLGLHWDITGRPIERGPRLAWLDSVQVKWFAWAAEYPETSIFGK